MVYEHRKHTGETPIVGVNTFTDSESSTPPADEFDIEVTRSDKAEKLMVIRRNQEFKESHSGKAEEGIKKLKKTAREGGNLFQVMTEIVEYCSVGQVTQALFESGGKFRRNM
jgi:methylmalonyl-CoA mutase